MTLPRPAPGNQKFLRRQVGGGLAPSHNIVFEEVKLSEERTWPVTLKVDIEPEELKRVVEEGRLMEFVGAFSALAAGHIKGRIVEQLAEAGVGLTKVGEGVSIDVSFDVDDPFWTRRPMPYIDTVPLPESTWGLRRIVREELGRIGKL